MAFSPRATPVPAPHQARGAQDVLRSMMEQMVQAAVEREFERFIGAAPWAGGSAGGCSRRRYLADGRERYGAGDPSLYESRVFSHSELRNRTPTRLVPRPTRSPVNPILADARG
jgi:hypothetical protein